jgi:hypothetical protein
MRIRRPAVGWLALAPLALAAACTSTETLSRFSAFAQTGGAYAKAVDALLQQAAQIQVDASSEKLLATRDDFGPVSRAELEKQDQADRAFINEITLLRRQAKLLADYFSALDALATSNQPQAFGATLGATAASLDALSQQLRGRGLAKDPQAAQALATDLGALVVKDAESHALKRELEQRKETISRVLQLHAALLGAVRDQVEANLEFARHREYEQQVEDPYLTTGAPLDANSWKQSRFQGLEPPDPVKQLDDAQSAARELQTAWTKLLTHKLGPSDLQAVTADLTPILASLDRL